MLPTGTGNHKLSIPNLYCEFKAFSSTAADEILAVPVFGHASPEYSILLH